MMRLKFCQCIIQRFLALINENFQKKNLDFVLDFDQNIDCGYMLDPVLMSMRGSRNFHERGSSENGNFWSQTRGGGPTPQKSRNNLFLGKIFKFQGGVRTPGPPLWIRA